MAILKTDYKDDILDTSQNTKRKYAMTENQDNTVSFDDETEYTQEGDNFGAQDINATNAQVNTNTGAIADINDNLTELNTYGDVVLIAQSSSESQESKTVQSIEQYRYIMLNCELVESPNNSIYTSTIIPISIFKNRKIIQASYQQTSIVALAKYVSDTSVIMWKHGTNMLATLYGIK